MEKREFVLTAEGAARLRKELEELKGPRRRELAQRLRSAIQMGDLSENADYIAAKEEQAFLEGRIQELETILRYAVVVEEGEATVDTVGVGNTVVVAENGREPETFHLVGIKEADPRNGKISHESPIGKALLGKRIGDTVVAQTPAGPLEFKILEIR